MTHFLRGVVLNLTLAAASFAATINFSGTGIEGFGIFSTVDSGTTFTGSVTVDSAGPDENLDNPNDNGQYSLLVGGIQLNIDGFGTFAFTPSQIFRVIVRTIHVSEGVDQVEVEANAGPFGQVLAIFYGDESGNFVRAPAAANGLDAVNAINWAHFSSGQVTLSSGGPIAPSSTIGALDLPQGEASFTIDNASNVPEPGTALVVLAGAAAIWMKRRSA